VDDDHYYYVDGEQKSVGHSWSQVHTVTIGQYKSLAIYAHSAVSTIPNPLVKAYNFFLYIMLLEYTWIVS
jgi:hypothetical protein